MNDSRKPPSTGARLAAASGLWGIFMLLSTHFMFGVSWTAGFLLWTPGAILFAIIVPKLEAARRGT